MFREAAKKVKVKGKKNLFFNVRKRTFFCGFPYLKSINTLVTGRYWLVCISVADPDNFAPDPDPDPA